MSGVSIADQRAAYSTARLEALKTGLSGLHELEPFNSLTIFGAGSFARLEASEYSDIDLFFLSDGGRQEVDEPKTKSLKLFGKVLEVAEGLNFPKFSNDCEYLVLLHAGDIIANLGNRTDDHENYFTARMLLLLESHCLFGQQTFDKITSTIVDSYFTDYPDHKQTFVPMFLLNDITRFWKTLLLNYENKRKLHKEDPQYEQKKTKQKVRNFKLKYSRMTTCFASVAALGSYLAPVKAEDVIAVTKMTPRERLASVSRRIVGTQDAVNEVLKSYDWFLQMTGQSTEQLEEHFHDKQRRTEMFQTANSYGDSMFRLLQIIDATDPSLRLVRNLVI